MWAGLITISAPSAVEVEAFRRSALAVDEAEELMPPQDGDNRAFQSRWFSCESFKVTIWARLGTATYPVIIDPTGTEELVRAQAVPKRWHLMVVDAMEAEVFGEVVIAARRIAARDGVCGRALKLASCYHVNTGDRLDRASTDGAGFGIYTGCQQPPPIRFTTEDNNRGAGSTGDKHQLITTY